MPRPAILAVLRGSRAASGGVAGEGRGVNIVKVYYFLFQEVLQVAGIACILVGALGIAFDHVDPSGAPYQQVRRIALATALGLVGALAYIFIPLFLDRAGLTPVPGHVRFYALFFAPAGFLAGILAVVSGTSMRRFITSAKGTPPLLSLQAYLIGFVTMSVIFFLYSRLVLVGGVFFLAIVRALITALVGALLFGIAPSLSVWLENRPSGRIAPVGFAFVLLGLIMVLVSTSANMLLSVHVDLF